MGLEVIVEREGHHRPIGRLKAIKESRLIKAMIPNKFSHVGLMCVSIIRRRRGNGA